MTTSETPAIAVKRLVDLEVRRHLKWISETIATRAKDLVEEITKGSGLRDLLSETQINNLIAVTNTADRVNEVRRFIQRQAEKGGAWKFGNIDRRLVDEISFLSGDAQEIVAEISVALKEAHSREGPEVDALSSNNRLRDEIHFLLVQDLILSFAIGYRYQAGRDRGPTGDDR